MADKTNFILNAFEDAATTEEQNSFISKGRAQAFRDVIRYLTDAKAVITLPEPEAPAEQTKK